MKNVITILVGIFLLAFLIGYNAVEPRIVLAAICGALASKLVDELKKRRHR